MHKPETQQESVDDIVYSLCAVQIALKSDRDIIERAQTDAPMPFFNVAGIDNSGLAKEGGLELVQNAKVNTYHRPTKLHKVPEAGQTWTMSADERTMRRKVVCKREKMRVGEHERTLVN